MKIGAHLIGQLERCGLSAQLAEDHREVGDDSKGARITRQEIGRAWAARDQAQTEEAHAALCWLSSLQARNVYGVEEELDLVDGSTGEVLVSGRPGAIIEQMDGEILVVSWVIGDHFDYPEPEDDLGLLAMGLAADIGVGFRVGHVYLKGGEAVCRRSPMIPVEAQPALWDRILQATSRPKVACPGDWCGACRQAPYCEAWLARARTAMALLLPPADVIDGVAMPQLEITSENAGELAARIKMVEAAAEMAKDQLKAAVRKGVRCVVDGKEYYARSCDSRETADVKALKADGLTKYIKTGHPFETFGWRKAGAR